jgi:teichuronic acid biosynthesis glycosyltransferase TuaG
MSRVSIIIPAYNAAAFVAAAIDSALAQTHPDVEVIVIDDSSTDDTAEVIAGYGSRIRSHRQPNGGVACARNTGARLATGEWVSFLDADDVWVPTKVAAQLAAGDAPWSYTNRYNFGERGGFPEYQSDHTLMTGGDVFEALLRRGNFITVSSVMMRKAVFDRMGGFYSQQGGCEDWDLWLRTSEHHPVSYVAEPLVGYRFTPLSMSRNHRAMMEARRSVVARALELPRGRALGWRLRRQIWAETFLANAWDAGRAGARIDAVVDYARAALAWPLNPLPYKEALKVCVHA